MVLAVGIAGVAAAQGRPKKAARLFGAAEALLEAGNTPMLATDRIEYERNLAAARAQLANRLGRWPRH